MSKWYLGIHHDRQLRLGLRFVDLSLKDGVLGVVSTIFLGI